MRAVLFRLLWRAFGPVPALAVVAAVFGALHLANPGATTLAGATVAMAGVMFCALFGAAVSGGDLGGSIAVSTARARAPTWLTRGAFGPEDSVVALVLLTALTVGALALVGAGRARTVARRDVPGPSRAGGRRDARSDVSGWRTPLTGTTARPRIEQAGDGLAGGCSPRRQAALEGSREARPRGRDQARHPAASAWQSLPAPA